MGGIWNTADVITKARMNQKSVLVDMGANISAATPLVGQLAYCTSTGSGFTLGVTYQYNGSAWVVFISIPTLQVADAYSSTIGDYTTPLSATASSSLVYPFSTTILYTATGSGGNWANTVNTMKVTALTPNGQIGNVGIYIASLPTGNIRVKVYQDDAVGGGPSTLLGESNSAAIGGIGWLDVTLISNAVIPASGNVWIGFEVDNNTVSIQYDGAAGPGMDYHVGHTFGPGPNPFGSISTIGQSFSVRYSYSPPSPPASLAVDANTTTNWISTSEIHPYIYADMGATAFLTGATLYWDGTDTTVTQILVQTSPDAVTWATVRTINTSLLTNGAWNYFRWDLPATALNRYVRFYGNDGTAKVLAIWEIKIKQYANTLAGLQSLFNVHGHTSISSSNGTLVLSA